MVPMTHILKIWPEYYDAIDSGEKTFEFRLNDRNYQTNDILILREYCPEKDTYSGREIQVLVTYVLYIGKYAVLSIRKILDGETGKENQFENKLVSLYSPRQNSQCDGRSFDFVYNDDLPSDERHLEDNPIYRDFMKGAER